MANMDASLFPDWEARNPPPKKVKRAWKPSPTQTYVLSALERRAMSDRGLHRYLVETVDDVKVGVVTFAAVLKAVDGLCKQGLVVDTGERGQWTTKGREIIWGLAAQREERQA